MSIASVIKKRKKALNTTEITINKYNISEKESTRWKQIRDEIPNQGGHRGEAKGISKDVRG